VSGGPSGDAGTARTADTMRPLRAAASPAPEPGATSGGTRRPPHPALPALGATLVLTTWWAVATWIVPASSFLARFAPDDALAALHRLVASGELWPHLATSLRRVLAGVALSVTLGLPLGLALARLRVFAGLFGPLFQFIRMVSPLSWTPLAIIVLGVGDAPVYFLIAIGGMWPIALNTSAGLAALDPRWGMVARSLGANRREVVRTIVWPGIRPHVLTGLRLAVGLAWLILVPAEMLGVDSGLGYFVLNTRDRLAYDELVAAILVIGACGFVIDALARWTFRERRGGLPSAGRRAGTAHRRRTAAGLLAAGRAPAGGRPGPIARTPG
jgi:NitT/TauT family transport system permease protein